MFSKLSKTRFIGPQIRKLLNDKDFDIKLNNVELNTWKSFTDVVHGFLGDNKTQHNDLLLENV